MKYWQLKVVRPLIGEEIFDLRTHPEIYVGDALTNDVCIDTTQIPGRLRVVKRGFRNRARVRLTQEVIPSFEGQFSKKKDWKTRLYSGAIFDIKNGCEWDIGSAHFTLSLKDTIKLTPLITEDRSLERKHWRQSFQAAMAIHLLALLIVFTAGAVYHRSHVEIRPADIQKVSIKEVDKMFPAEVQPTPEPIPAQVAEANPVPVEDAAPAAPQVKEKIAPAKGNLKQASTKLPVQKSPAPARKPVETLGLLAIQSTSKSSQRNVDVAALAVGSTALKAADPDRRTDLGLAKGEAEFGISAGTEGGSQVAMLDPSGVEAYQGGLSDQVKKGSLRGATIKLIRREVEIRGALDPAVIRQIIEERLPEVRYCYETALLKQTNLQGKISASWTIQPDGSVTDLSSESEEIKSNVLHPCIRDQIKNWKFPTPKGGGVVHVKYPFLFSPVGS